MEGVIRDGFAAGPVGNSTVRRGSQLPLSLLGEGETASVVRVRGGQELRQHLSELGFVEGAEVKVVSRINGDVIVSVKGASLALDRSMSSHISVG